MATFQKQRATGATCSLAIAYAVQLQGPGAAEAYSMHDVCGSFGTIGFSFQCQPGVAARGPAGVLDDETPPFEQLAPIHDEVPAPGGGTGHLPLLSAACRWVGRLSKKPTLPPVPPHAPTRRQWRVAQLGLTTCQFGSGRRTANTALSSVDPATFLGTGPSCSLRFTPGRGASPEADAAACK